MDKNISTREQEIKIRDLIAKPFTVFAHTPHHASLREEEITTHLRNVKSLIVSSAELARKQSFEI
jgi:hypothetical protein